MKKRKGRRRREANFKGMCCISAVILVLLVVLSVKSHTLKQRNAVYQEEIAQLQKQMDEETTRTQEIKDLEAYMQTDEYAEQVAKDKLGLVYEDEIIFKPEEN